MSTETRSRKRSYLSTLSGGNQSNFESDDEPGGNQSNFESDDEPIITRITRVDDPIAVITLDEEVPQNPRAQSDSVKQMRCIQPAQVTSNGSNPQPSTWVPNAKPSTYESDGIPVIIPSPVLLSPEDVGGKLFDEQSSDESGSIKSTEDGDLGNEASSPYSESSASDGNDLFVPSPTLPSSTEEDSEEVTEEECDS